MVWIVTLETTDGQSALHVAMNWSYLKYTCCTDCRAVDSFCMNWLISITYRAKASMEQVLPHACGTCSALPLDCSFHLFSESSHTHTITIKRKQESYLNDNSIELALDPSSFLSSSPPFSESFKGILAALRPPSSPIPLCCWISLRPLVSM